MGPQPIDLPIDVPGAGRDGTRALLLRQLDWYRDALWRKLDGLTEEQLRRPVPPIGWAPLAVAQHLAMVERRWLRWGFAAQDVAPDLGDRDAEWRVEGAAADVLAFWRAESEQARDAVGEAPLDAVAALGGRFVQAADAPTLAAIVVHVLQEYARHLGQLDVVRELLDGRTGE